MAEEITLAAKSIFLCLDIETDDVIQDFECFKLARRYRVFAYAPIIVEETIDWQTEKPAAYMDEGLADPIVHKYTSGCSEGETIMNVLKNSFCFVVGCQKTITKNLREDPAIGTWR